MADTTMTIGLQADASAFQDVLSDLEKRAKSFGSALSDALTGAIVDGDSLTDVLTGLASKIASIALDTGMKPLQSLLSKGIGAALGGLTGFADGGVPGRIQPFADGGVVSSPTFFPMGQQMGLMGEAGSEAIMPLRRGPDGKLGVAASGAAGDASPPVIIHIHAQDVESFRKSQGQVAAMLARTTGRGRRGL